MKKISLVASIVFLLVGCNQTKEIAETKHIGKIPYVAAMGNTVNNGYTLMKNNCYVCHSPNATSHDSIIAPLFAAVKRRYSMQYGNKEDFVNAVVDWAASPHKEKALMYGAITKFKIMPKLFLEKSELEKIAIYIYENDVEQPEWFAAHFNEMHGQGMGMGNGRKMNRNRN